MSAAGLAQVRTLRAAGRFLEAERVAAAYIRTALRDPAGHLELGFVHLQAERPDKALPCLMQAVQLNPKKAAHHYWAGMTLLALARDMEALTAFETAVSLEPKLADAHERLGNLFLNNGHDDRAAASFRKAAAAAPDTAAANVNQAQSLRLEGRREDAEALLRDSVDRFPDDAATKRRLAGLLSQRGDFAAALPLLEAATEGSPSDAAAAYYDIVNAKRITADDQPAIDQMEALLKQRAVPGTARQWLHFGLGKANDDLGHYAAAMAHFQAANLVTAQQRPFDRAYFGACVHRMIASTDAAFFAPQRSTGSPSELPLLIIGMPRSGTTLVEQILSSHPDIAAGGELPFWNRAAERFGRLGQSSAPAEFIRTWSAEYDAALRAIGPAAQRVTDKTPGNFIWLGLFHLAFPRGRIVHCRRNPVDTCLSNYFTHFNAPVSFAYDKGDLAFYYRAYRRMMAHWRTALPAGTMLEVDYEDVVAEPEAMARRLIDFAGLPWDDACLRPQDNQRVVQTASQWQVRQPTYRRSVERWRRYEPWLGPLRGLLEHPEFEDDPAPFSDNAAIPQARKLCNANRFDEALMVLQDALRADRLDAVCYNELGTVFLRAGRADEAVQCFDHALGLNPAFAVAHYNQAAALERLGRSTEAVASLRLALAADPGHGGAYSRLGNLLQTRGEHAQALECFRRAMTLLTKPADRALEQAKLLRADGHHTEAEAALRQVVALDPANPLARMMLGDTLAEFGRFDEATECFETVAGLDPGNVNAVYNIAIMRHVDRADDPLIARLETLLETRRPDVQRSLLHFALGKLHDDLADPPHAIGHFDAANAIEHANLPFDRAALSARVDGLIAKPAPAVEAAAADSRPVFVLGMPRSGTTLVEQILSAHAAVAGGGELPFWTSQQDGPGTRDPTAGTRYLDLLGRIAPAALRVTDKNPFNFFEIGRIHAALPQARFIHCRRDPIDTCLSIYFTRFATPQPFAYDREDLVFFYRQYRRLMAHWQAVLPPGTLLTIDYEALIASPEAQTRRMVACLGLEWDAACLAPERNPAIVRTASLWQARQPVHGKSVARWRRYEPWLGALRDLHDEAGTPG